MEKNKIALLRGEIDAQVNEIEKIYRTIEERAKGKSCADTEGLSLWLHNLYCAFEDLFKIVAEVFENNIGDAKSYHMELLRRMVVSIKGVRPKLLSEESFQLLDNLRAFRHFLRHAYVYVVDERKVRLVLEDARRLKQIYKGDIAAFVKQLKPWR